MHSEDIKIITPDGYSLTGTVFRPAAARRKTVLIAPAIGTLRRLYHDYSLYLAESGFSVITWDWRGIGDSRPKSLRGFAARLRQWGERDLVGVIEWAETHAPGQLLLVGHSHGGQCLGLAENRAKLARIVTIAAPSGYWALAPKPLRYKYAIFFYFIMPGITRLLGWFPARPFGLGQDLPAGVALDWARWCRQSDYMGSYEGHRSMRAPILALAFSDDPYASPAAVDWLHEKFGATEKIVRHITPNDYGVARIGHLGFFKKGVVPTLWDETAQWLAQE